MGHVIDHSFPSSAEINNKWSYTSTSPECLLDMDMDNFTFHHESFSLILIQYDDDDDI
jgi:hypothetical protein